MKQKTRRKCKSFKKLLKIVVLCFTFFVLTVTASQNAIGQKILDSYYEKQSIMLSVEAVSQHPDYPTGCESVALYMLLKYYHVDVTIEEIVDALPKGPVPYEKDGILYGANPEKEFVGNPKDANSYGVFQEPIAEVANLYKKHVIAQEGAAIKDIVQILDTGNPVIAWYTTSPDKPIEYRRQWLDYETREKVRWPAGEHAVVVYGHDRYNLFYNDPNTGTGCSAEFDYFEKAFLELGGRIVPQL